MLPWLALLLSISLILAIFFLFLLHRRSQRDAARLALLVQLNRDLVTAADEKSLVEAALAAINRLVDGLGASFVPFDAWGQALPAFVFGGLPEPVLRGWAEHLLAEETRSRCEACTARQALEGQPCPLKPGPLGLAAMSIFCLPLNLGERSLGMLNLYLPPNRTLGEETRAFLQGVIDEMALAVDAIRLRNQEVAALRQLQQLRAQPTGLTDSLQALLDGVRSALGVDALALQVRGRSGEHLSNLRIFSGDIQTEQDLEGLLAQALTGQSQSAGANNWLPAPLVLPEGQSLGVLVALHHAPLDFNPRQQRLLQTTAAQAALMIENERRALSLEYAAVIRERGRLAREIHDGLAQTLAFLKIQLTQMQSAINLGDTERINRLLGESRQVLADAYDETRQSIDNLRLEPTEDLTEWLEQLALAFERAAGIPVTRQFQPGEWEVMPEIAAQLVRIVQEALNNARKHANASRVSLALRRWQRDLVVEVSDDGQGFDPEDVPAVARYGLRGMRERAELIGAEFQIISQPESGATVRISLPLAIEEEQE